MISKKDLFFNIIFPRRCLSCNTSMPIDSKAMFCFKCSKEYFRNTGAVCEICGKPINENRDITCALCKKQKPYYIKNISRYQYRGCIKTAIQNMKFKRRMWISFELGRALSKTVQEKYSDINFDMILYVPMTTLNDLLRGFNQSHKIASMISKEIKVPIKHNILYKKTGIKTQSGLNRKQRIENVKNAFYIKNSHLIEDKTILIVDDVFTTGCTINACSKLLKKNGALAVYAATVATVTTDE